MKFEYNGNLSENDRINLVVKEIISKYPQISEEKAKKAAMLEGKISMNKSIEDELNRLYNIMLVNCDNKNNIINIYEDFLNIIKYNNVREDNIYFRLIDEINKYFQSDFEFPILSDYQ